MASLNAWEPVTLCQRWHLHLAGSHFDLKQSTASSQDWIAEQERQLLLFHLINSAFLLPRCQSQHELITLLTSVYSDHMNSVAVYSTSK